MSIFRKNPNEVLYSGGKKHWTDVIKNSSTSSCMIWKQPEEDFNTNSTLIVMPGETAVFVKNGIIEQVFENGTYKLSTENYPFISRLRNVFSGGISAFNCVVYFVRKSHTEEIRWGTETPIQIRDKVLGIATEIKARGSYKVCVDNPSLFLEKMIGSKVSFLNQSSINKFYISELQSIIKSSIANSINNSNEEVLGISTKLQVLSDEIKPKINDSVSSYGLNCVDFHISAIDVSDDELRRKYDEIGMQAYATIKASKASKVAIGILGEDWERQKQVDILQAAASNPNGMAGLGASFGVGLMAGNMMKSINEKSNSNNGNKNESDLLFSLETLKRMMDSGLIDEKEYNEKKKEILGRL